MKKKSFLMVLLLSLFSFQTVVAGGFEDWKEVVQYGEDFENVKIRFNKSLDGSSLNRRNIKLYENNRQISFAYELGDGGSLLLIYPEIESFHPDNEYEIELADSLRSLDGVGMDRGLLAKFYIDKTSKPGVTGEDNPYEGEINRAVFEALKNYEDGLEIHPEDMTLDQFKSEFKLDDISNMVSENPDIDLGYTGVEMSYTYSGNKVKKINIDLKYSGHMINKGGVSEKFPISRTELLKKKDQMDRIVAGFIRDYIDDGMTDLEKEIVVHDYIVKNAEYNLSALEDGLVSQDNYTAYGVLVKGTGVCDGYSKAFYTLGKAAGLEVKYVAGHAFTEAGSMGHAWNLVKLDGQWYAVDSTWDDPIASNWDKPKDYVRYDYFNVTDDMIRSSHARNQYYKDKYPKATGTKYGRDELINQGIIKSPRSMGSDPYRLPVDYIK